MPNFSQMSDTLILEKLVSSMSSFKAAASARFVILESANPVHLPVPGHHIFR